VAGLNYHIFDPNQAKVFPKLDFLSRNNFYLAGGTALALQLGHRTSVDFDFYCPKHFDESALFKQIENIFGQKAKITVKQKDSLFCRINNVECSFFRYQYPLIKKPLKSQGPPLASMEDIAAMKLIAVSMRPVKRDYIDIYYLLNKFNLEKMFSFVKKKYPNFNEYFAVRALTYFEDITEGKKKRDVRILEPGFSWDKAQETIFEAAKKYQLEMIKG